MGRQGRRSPAESHVHVRWVCRGVERWYGPPDVQLLLPRRPVPLGGGPDGVVVSPVQRGRGPAGSHGVGRPGTPDLYTESRTELGKGHTEKDWV